MELNEKLFEELDPEEVKMNNDLFPIVDFKDNTRYKYYKYKGKDFAYDLKDNLLLTLFRDENEVKEYGKLHAPWREMDSVGLSKQNWSNKKVRDEYLDEYIEEQNQNVDALAQDFIANELKYYKESLNDNYNKLDQAYDGWYYTITGVGGDINEWKEGYQELLDKENIGTIKDWIEFTGEDMNKKYHLTGNNAYANDLHFLAFPLDGLDTHKLAIFKLKMEDRWFNDIVDNNTHRQKLHEDINNSFQLRDRKAIFKRFLNSIKNGNIKEDFEITTRDNNELDSTNSKLNKQIIDRIFLMADVVSRELNLDKKAVVLDIIQDLNIIKDRRNLNNLKDTPADRLTKSILDITDQLGITPDSNIALNFLLDVTEDQLVNMIRYQKNMFTQKLSNNNSDKRINFKDESLEEEYSNEKSNIEIGKTYTNKDGNKLTIKNVIPSYSEYDGTPLITIDYDYEKANGEKGTSHCNSVDFFNMIKDSKIEEALKEHLDEEVKDSPEIKDNGLAQMLIDAINVEWDSIKEYNDLIVNAETYGYSDIANIVRDIADEENIHVGQLQKALESISPNAASIQDGEEEAEQSLEVPTQESEAHISQEEITAQLN